MLVLCLLLIGAFMAVPSLARQKKSDVSLREQFVGAWSLLSIETIRPNGE
jgi:hypothetical protein